MANFTELDRYLFGQATHYDIYRKLGAHFAEVKGVKGVYFDLWAPNDAPETGDNGDLRIVYSGIAGGGVI